MPITIAPGYSDYRTMLANGELEIAGVACPVSPTCPGQLVLTSSRVWRGVVLLKHDEYGVTRVRKTDVLLALCRCNGCGKRFRVLPSDILAHKTFSVPAIECLLAIYATWERSLRATVDRIDGDRTPTHSTLHEWTEGLGVHVLDRPCGRSAGAPFTTVLAESTRRVPSVADVDRHPEVDPRRYRSEPRRDRLQAMAFVLVAASIVTDVAVPGSLSKWRSLAVSWLTMSSLGFASKIRRTPFERLHGAPRPRCAFDHRRSAEECPIQPRSPPADSS